jgi:hypothetical protein
MIQGEPYDGADDSHDSPNDISERALAGLVGEPHSDWQRFASSGDNQQDSGRPLYALQGDRQPERVLAN